MNRTWWAVAALLALVAMHGLATHATTAESAPTSHASSHASDAGHGEAAGRALGSELPPTEHGSEHHAMSVLGMCLAALAATAIALMGLTPPGRGLLALLPRATSVPSRAVGVARTHAPPDLHALSVLRC